MNINFTVTLNFSLQMNSEKLQIPGTINQPNIRQTKFHVFINSSTTDTTIRFTLPALHNINLILFIFHQYNALSNFISTIYKRDIKAITRTAQNKGETKSAKTNLNIVSFL